MYSEIYGLGMLMYFCLTGKTFYKVSIVKEPVNLHNAPLRVSDLSQKMAQMYSGIAAVIDKMIKKNSSGRFQSYKEAYQALERIRIR